MKFTLSNCNFVWNGVKPLPSEIHVISQDIITAELELLTILCRLHGHLTAFDILTGADSNTEKDADISSVFTAFQQYLVPRMPVSNYSAKDMRSRPVVVDRKHGAIDSDASNNASK